MLKDETLPQLRRCPQDPGWQVLASVLRFDLEDHGLGLRQGVGFIMQGLGFLGLDLGFALVSQLGFAVGSS